MVTQFDYLARIAGYASIADNLEDFTDSSVKSAPNFVNLATEIFKNTNTIPADGTLGQIVGVDPNVGTFTFPAEVINSSMEILEEHHLAIEKTEETVDENGEVKIDSYYDKNESQIVVSGDTIPSLSSFSTKINNLKDSIDRGMPIIWWTLGGNKAGDFSNHYMNIFGYEYWMGTDTLGNTKTHLMFILRYNWGWPDIYMDSNILDAVNGGFIYFEETHEKTLIRPENYDLTLEYDSFENQKSMKSDVGYNFCAKYLRTGYLNDSEELISANRQVLFSPNYDTNGVSYLEYKFPIPVKWIYLELSWYESLTKISANDGRASIDYKDYHSHNWQTQLNLLNVDVSTTIFSKTRIKCEFKYPITEFRIYIELNSPIENIDKGKLVVGNLIAIHEDYKHTYSYSLKNRSGHRADCLCGYSTFQTHSAKAGQTGGRYVNCSGCGYLIDLFTDFVPIIKNMKKRY